jgi:enoyl-CoA hydratase/carnithine racemase
MKMSGLKEIEFNTNEFSCVVENDLAVITVKGNAFFSISSVERNADIIPWLTKIENTSAIRGLLLMNEKEAYSEKSYLDFLRDIAGDDFDSKNPKDFPQFIKNDIRAREINILASLLLKLYGFQKIVISGINGDIVTPFFGLSLLSDFRFTSANTNFVLSHIKYRIHPSGGLPFLLPYFLSQSKMMEILLRGNKLSAPELKNLGLIHEHYDEKEFIEKTKAKAAEICSVSKNVVQCTKSLIYRNKKDLEDYLRIESKFMMR